MNTVYSKHKFGKSFAVILLFLCEFFLHSFFIGGYSFVILLPC